MTIHDIAKDGMSLPASPGAPLDFSSFSLRQALLSYFGSYKAVGWQFHIFDSAKEVYRDNESVMTRYHDAYVESVLHLHHFVELTLKRLLRSRHELLAVDASNRHTILYKLLFQQPITEEDKEGLNTPEFASTLERTCQLIDANGFPSMNLQFIKANREALEVLNRLRNRAWHRGTFVLRYRALDTFFGTFALPFVKQLIAETNGGESWKYRPLHCKIDPLEEIISETKKPNWDIGKIAFLKELGRAAYQNPIETSWFAKMLDDPEPRVKASALTESKGVPVKTCPVCGIESLVVYEDYEPDATDTSTGKTVGVQYSFKVACMCCSFEMNHHLKNPKDYGYNIDDLWYAK